MKSTVDSPGRVLIPKELRERLGLRRGQRVEVRERDGCVEIEPHPTLMSLVRSGRVAVAVPRETLPPLTDEIVREVLEGTRR